MRNSIGISTFLKMIIVPSFLLIAACSEEEVTNDDVPVRGLKTVTIEDVGNMQTRRYPSVLQPADTTTLSFEINGRLGENNLEVGQSVTAGEVLLELDRRSLELSVENAQAAFTQAEVNARNAQDTYERQKTLFERNVVNRASLDQSETNALSATAQQEQARASLETAEENLSKAELKAPFDGVINTVSIDSFATVAPGTAVATLHNPNSYEARFSVSYEIVTRLTVGKPVTVRLADYPTLTMQGVISELASSADTVSSFPVIVQLTEIVPEIKGGMAIEVAIDINVPRAQEQGYLIPFSALLVEGDAQVPNNPIDPLPGTVFIYDEETQSVKKSTVQIAGVTGNSVIIVDGLKRGDRVASAGVPFLKEGQKVKLLSAD